MDGFNTIQDGGVNQLLTRRLNVPSGPAASLAPEVMPVLSAAQYDASWDYVAQIRRAASRSNVAAAAGTYSGVRLRNPAGSNVLIVVERAFLSSGVASGLLFGTTPANTNLTSVGASASRDTRQPFNVALVQTTAIVSTTNTAGTPTFTTSGIASGFFIDPANTTRVLELGYVLAPGSSFEVWGLVVNQSVVATLHWTERQAQPSELV